MTLCPCKDCNVRSETCHGICKAYKEWSVENEKIRDEVHRKINLQRIGVKKK